MNHAVMKTFIMSHPQLYTEQLLIATETNEEKLDYVFDYPFASKISYRIDLSEEAFADRIPLLLQWDKRWGYCSYGDGLIGCNGCGPTCLSMVSIYLTKNKMYTPLYVARQAERMGHYVIGSGTSWDLLRDGCKAFGIISAELSWEYKCICEALDMNHPVILSVGKGDFTSTGHFIVITGHENGCLSIHDPNSRKRSKQLWSYEHIKDQILHAWAYERLNSANSEPVELI